MNRWIGLLLLGCNASGTSTVELKDNGSTMDQTVEDTGSEETDPEAEDDPFIGSKWYGERLFVIEGLCEETLIENGTEVTEPGQEETLLSEQCPDCIQAFRLDVSPESICDGQIGVSSTTFRTTSRVDDGPPELYFFTATDTGEFQLNRTVELLEEDGRWTYNYEGTWGSFEYIITGFFELTD